MPDYSERWSANQVEVTVTSGDWTSSRKIKRRGLKFAPSAAGDVLIVREVGEASEKSGWPRTKLTATIGDTIGCLFHDTVANYILIDMAASDLSVPADCVITFDYEP
jgi:hypothetical protein